MRELLVVIDYQNDFVTGALGNPAAAALEPTYIPARCNLELCTSLNSSGSFAYEEQDCSLTQPVNPWKVVWDEKGVGHLVRRKRQ